MTSELDLGVGWQVRGGLLRVKGGRGEGCSHSAFVGNLKAVGCSSMDRKSLASLLDILAYILEDC